MQEPLDKVRVGRIRPKSIAIRILIPDTTTPMSIPCRADDLSDSPEFRARMTRLANRYVGAMIDTVNELNELGLVEKATAVVHTHHAAPLFKLYIVSGEQAFFGFYLVVEHVLTVDGESQTIYDLPRQRRGWIR